ncbi:hypothetical protein [Methylomonas rhizoryzae]|uniref:hypothetical protein n=1 Tax=Methylomonas rhizoryzae TaxID=2608981 RepID=UPI001232F136|nr:hypothetical protein [Methylomonas rhizoryzae]
MNSLKVSIIFFLTLLGCSKDITIERVHFPNEFDFVFYENGTSVFEKKIDDTDVVYQVLYKWHVNNVNEWRSDFNTYAPSYLFHSEKLSFNFITDARLVVVNFMDTNNNWHQAKKDINPNSDIFKILDNIHKNM